MVDYQSMGRRMKVKRRSKHLSQQDMAKMIGISSSFYGNIERGLRIPSIDTLVQIAFAYQQQAGSLIRRIPENTPALRDEKLNGFLEALMEAAWSIDTSRFSNDPAGKVEINKSS